jgi:hypothetical protein
VVYKKKHILDTVYIILNIFEKQRKKEGGEDGFLENKI